MIYQRDNNRKKQRRLKTFSIIGGLLVFTLILNYFLPHLFSPAVQAVEIPASITRSGMGGFFSNLLGTFHSKKNLVLENRTLREKVALYDALRIERDATTEENDILKALLGKASTTGHEVVSRIISKPGFSPYDTMILDAGERDGVHVGDLVLADRSVVVGEVAQVYKESSNVIMYSSSDRKTNVLIGTEALETEALGKGGGNFEIELPRNANVKVGDIVHLAAYPDKVFGSITVVNVADADSFEKVLFRSVVDITHISHVTVYRQ
jgi:cell shape-determining protein MreC